MKNMNFDALSSFLKSLEESGLPSCEMSVSLCGQEVFAFSRPEKPVYMAYSLTKPVTCALALKLFERGAFTMDDRLSDFIPEFADPSVTEILPDGTRRIRPAKREITLRDLFTMTAGFGYDAGALIKADTLAAIRALAAKPLLFDPGQHWNYSLCHDVLGAVLQVISGKKLRQLMRDEIFFPLGMTKTCFLGEVETLPALCDAAGKPLSAPDTRFMPSREYDSGGAGLITCLSDYSAFCRALGEGKIISPHTLSLMTTDHLNDVTRRDFNWPQVRGYGYGLGVRVLTDKAAGGSPSPKGEFGWGGVSGCWSLIDPDNRLTAVFMARSLGTDEKYLFPRLRNVLYGCI